MKNKKLGLNTIKCNKKSICSLSLVLMLTMTLMMAFSQPGLAQIAIPQPVKTAGYISIAPTLIGVGQTATVNLWVFPLPSNYLYQPFYKGFEGITVTFTKPDGTKDTFMPVDGTGQFAAGQTESLGSMYFSYEPNMAGDWSATFTMPEQNITDNTGIVIYSACTSSAAYFTVQTDPVNAGLLNGYPWAELPNENTFWNYPINSNNREWNAISGDWLQGGTGNGALNVPFSGVTSRLWQPYGTGPNTGHIVWSQQLSIGGLVGGDYGSLSYSAISSSSGRGVVVMAGKVYANVPSTNTFKCIDLATGEELYTASGSITCGIHLPGNAAYQSNNDPSVVLASSYGSTPTAYLYQASGTTWNYYNPLTGAIVRSLSNCSSARLVDGTNLAYGAASGNLFAWNMSKVVNNNWPTGIEWSRPLPETLLGSSPAIFGITADVSTIVLRTTNQYWGYSAKDGTSLWNLTITYPVLSNQAITLYGVDDFIVYNGADSTFNCYSMATGALLWTSDSLSDSPWATTWTIYSSETNDYDNLYLMFPDGTMTALSLENGETLWRSQAILSTEYTNNVVPYVVGLVMEGGNIYAYAGYSTAYQLNPIPRFAMLTCVNATTGNTIWTLNGGIHPVAAANGYVIGPGINDGNLYCVGKGQTSTTVTIQNNVITNHATTLITGNILDQSPAQAGTPAVADASISEWMDYLHMQNSTLLNNPPNPKGVPITLTAVDPNGNTITIGTTTTDSKGNYAINFTPETTGIYTIKATFNGTNAYYSSDSEAHLTVITEAASTTTPINYETNNNTMMTLTVGMGIAIIITIAIATLLILKKRA
ncbi:MAG: PQQ-binding-like beta-propeller repeat protein [Candidatus Bathyarchaeia archaeon]|jgi:outer membrane protein assembly factor BamB